MSETKTPFQAMMEMGQTWVRSVNPAAERFVPEGFEMLWPTMPSSVMESVMGKTFNPGGLDSKTKLLITLAGLTMAGAEADAQIRLTVRHAMEAGASAQEIAETIAVVGVFAGVPAMQRSLQLAQEAVMSDSGASNRTAGDDDEAET